ncbi:hypothetical protein Hanom_Chr03g00232821 [Helianthus anomalus]
MMNLANSLDTSFVVSIGYFLAENWSCSSSNYLDLEVDSENHYHFCDLHAYKFKAIILKSNKLT